MGASATPYPKKRTGLKIAAGLVVLIAVVALALPLFVNAETLRPVLESKLSAALGRKVQVSDLHFSLFSGGVAADGLSISDDPAFGPAPFIQAKAVKVSVSLLPLIFSHKLDVQGITIEDPRIVLIQSPAGRWNYSSLGNSSAAAGTSAQAPAAPAQKTAAPPRAPSESDEARIGQIRISGGSFSVTQDDKHPLVLENVDLQMKNVSAASVTPFSLSASLAGGGKFELSGTEGPINPADTAATPFNATLKITHLDLVASGLMQPAEGIAGIADLTASASQKGNAVHLEGKASAQDWKVATAGTPVKHQVGFDFAVDHDRSRQAGRLTKGDIHIGKALATLTGRYDLRGESPAIDVALSAPNLPGSELAPVLPAFDVVLPAGTSLSGGTVMANLHADGPLDRLTTTGTIGLDNVRLDNFDLASKLRVLETLAGLKPSPRTEIQTLRTNVTAAPEVTKLDGIRVVIPSIGELTGSGTISASHALDFKMTLQMAKSGGLIPMLGSVGTVPFTVGGTAQDPKFAPDVGAIAAGRAAKILQKNPAAKSILEGIFGRKKK
ncbi:MAG TPA: AsmA family protein [Bryobacteraceae bacterium]|jgi:AsmA protein|nr:AsmA family protein [Bryobacteraceae bacterium]